MNSESPLADLGKHIRSVSFALVALTLAGFATLWDDSSPYQAALGQLEQIRRGAEVNKATRLVVRTTLADLDGKQNRVFWERSDGALLSLSEGPPWFQARLPDSSRALLDSDYPVAAFRSLADFASAWDLALEFRGLVLLHEGVSLLVDTGRGYSPFPLGMPAGCELYFLGQPAPQLGEGLAPFRLASETAPMRPVSDLNMPHGYSLEVAQQMREYIRGADDEEKWQRILSIGTKLRATWSCEPHAISGSKCMRSLFGDRQGVFQDAFRELHELSTDPELRTMDLGSLQVVLRRERAIANSVSILGLNFSGSLAKSIAFLALLCTQLYLCAYFDRFRRLLGRGQRFDDVVWLGVDSSRVSVCLVTGLWLTAAVVACGLAWNLTTALFVLGATASLSLGAWGAWILFRIWRLSAE